MKCYDLFMKGRDTFEELDAEVQSKLSKFSNFKYSIVLLVSFLLASVCSVHK